MTSHMQDLTNAMCVVAGQKGSDVSAREATKKLVAATKQMHALQAVLQDIHISDSSWPQHTGGAVVEKVQSSDENARSAAAEAGPWAAKNTIVRDVLNELTNAAQKSRTRLRIVSQQTAPGHKGSGLLPNTGRSSPAKQKQ